VNLRILIRGSTALFVYGGPRQPSCAPGPRGDRRPRPRV